MIPLSTFLRVFGHWDISATLYSYLDFSGMANFCEAWADELRDFFEAPGSRETARLFNRRTPKRLQVPGRLTLARANLLWHWSLHSIRLRGLRHSFPHYDFPTDCFKVFEAHPRQPKRRYSACAFFPPEAPYPYTNALALVEFCKVKIFAQGRWRYTLLLEHDFGSFVCDMALSPGGKTMVCKKENKKLVLLSFDGEGPVRLKKTDLRHGGRTLSDIFWDERSFVLPCPNRDLFLVEWGEDWSLRQKLMLKIPRVSRLTLTDGQVWERQDGGGVFSPEWRFRGGPFSFALATEECVSLAGTSHSLRIAPSPERGEWLGLDLGDSIIVDVTLHPTQPEIFVVVLTAKSQETFADQVFFTERRVFLSEQDCVLDGSRLVNLGVYRVDLTGRPLVAEPRFFVPSSPDSLASEEVEGKEGRRFGKAFAAYDRSRYRAYCNRVFLVVRYDYYHLFMFALDASYDSAPFSFGVNRKNSLYASTAEMCYAVCLPRHGITEAPTSLRLFRSCPCSGFAHLEDGNKRTVDAPIPPPAILVVS